MSLVFIIASICILHVYVNESAYDYTTLHQGVGEGTTPFPGLLHFTLDTYLIMLSVKQGYMYIYIYIYTKSTETIFIYLFHFEIIKRKIEGPFHPEQFQ